jgi:hypothetical protein
MDLIYRDIALRMWLTFFLMLPSNHWNCQLSSYVNVYFSTRPSFDCKTRCRCCKCGSSCLGSKIQVPLVARTTSASFLELSPISAEIELTGYLQSECELFGTDENATILTWWKSNAFTRYPQLSMFARSILAVPATSNDVVW